MSTEKVKKVNFEEAENEEVQAEEKKPFFNKEKLKRIGIIVGGAIIGGLAVIVGMAFLGNHEEDSSSTDEEPDFETETVNVDGEEVEICHF